MDQTKVKALVDGLKKRKMTIGKFTSKTRAIPTSWNLPLVSSANDCAGVEKVIQLIESPNFSDKIQPVQVQELGSDAKPGENPNFDLVQCHSFITKYGSGVLWFSEKCFCLDIIGIRAISDPTSIQRSNDRGNFSLHDACVDTVKMLQELLSVRQGLRKDYPIPEESTPTSHPQGDTSSSEDRTLAPPYENISPPQGTTSTREETSPSQENTRTLPRGSAIAFQGGTHLSQEDNSSIQKETYSLVALTIPPKKTDLAQEETSFLTHESTITQGNTSIQEKTLPPTHEETRTLPRGSATVLQEDATISQVDTPTREAISPPGENTPTIPPKDAISTHEETHPPGENALTTPPLHREDTLTSTREDATISQVDTPAREAISPPGENTPTIPPKDAISTHEETHPPGENALTTPPLHREDTLTSTREAISPPGENTPTIPPKDAISNHEETSSSQEKTLTIPLPSGGATVLQADTPTPQKSTSSPLSRKETPSASLKNNTSTQGGNYYSFSDTVCF